MNTILLIGAGNMGGAMGKALLSAEYLPEKNFLVANPSPEKLEFFQKKNCPTSQNAEELIPHADIIILAIKPQLARNFLESMREKHIFSPDQIIISIAAGVSVFDLQQASGIAKIVRVMPNTPLLVGKGVSGYYFSQEVSQKERQKISDMMQVFGLAIECKTEEKINAITALSGSGPAYFFRILESMGEQGEQFGFSKEDSEKIALHTLLGAGLLAEQSPENFSTLRKNVTSKGGTTEAALKSFEDHGLSDIFQRGMQAAKKRSDEL